MVNEGNDDIEDEDEDEDDWNESYFPIAVQYQPLFDRLAASCDLLLKRANISPREISYIGKLQYALSRLPRVTEGVSLDVLLSYKTDDQGSWGGPYLALREDRLSIEYAGYVRGPYGGDSDCQEVFDCESGGYRSDHSDGHWVTKDRIEAWLADWENCCIDTDVTLKITDDTDEFDWDQAENDDPWSMMPGHNE